MDIRLESQSTLDSPIHRWDPALKMVGLGLFILALAALLHVQAILVGMAVSILLARAAGFSLLQVASRVKWIFLLLLPLFLLLPLRISLGGATPIVIGWSKEGLVLAGVISLRAMAIAIAIFPMWGTAPLHVSLKALSSLGVPDMLVQLVLFTYRYLFVYFDQFHRVRLALAARGFSPGLDARSFRVYGSQVGMLLVTSYEQAERVLAAMKSRGYDGRIRTLETPKRELSDWVRLALLGAVSILLVIGDRLWLG